MRPWTAVALGFAAVGCGETGTSPRTSTDPLTNFDALWEGFDQSYSFFVLKGVDWDSARALHRTQASVASDAGALFEVFTNMILGLEDGHAYVTSPFRSPRYTGWFDRFAVNFDRQLVRDGYLGASARTTPNGRMTYGRVAPDIGYVHVPSLSGDGFGADLDAALTALADVSGLVLDVRHNSGGSDLNGKEIAGRFVDQTRHFRTIRFRDGPAHDDFGPPVDDFISPITGAVRYDGPVVLLTNRRVFSAGEGFVLAMRVAPNVTVLGDTTGGGSANPDKRTLPNGWSYSVSRWIVFTPDGDTFEGQGLAPDSAVQIDPVDAAQDRDTILDTAIAILQGS